MFVVVVVVVVVDVVVVVQDMKRMTFIMFGC